MTTIRQLPLLVGCLLAASCWAGQDVGQMSLEDLLKLPVEGASRHAQPLAETPSTVTVISAEDIRRFGFRDLGDALQSARGVYITRDRSYAYLGVRGFGRPGDYNSRIVLLQDGVRNNDPVYDQAMVGMESPVELDWVKRLEFVPGPSSAAYGGNALFGIVNAVYWSGADLAGGRLAVDIGEYRAGKASVLAGGVTAGGLDWMSGVSLGGKRGEDIYFREFDAPATNDGVARRLDGERTLKGLLKLGWGDWQAAVNYASRRKDVPTAYYSTLFNTPGNFTEDQQFHLRLAHGKALSEEWSQNIRLNLGQARYDAEYPFAGQLNRDEMRANWWDLDYQVHYTGWNNHRLLLGVEVRRMHRLEQRNFDVDPPAPRFDDNHSARANGFYVQDVWRLAPAWILNAGLRVDQQTDVPTMTSPRLALIHQWSPQTTWKALYGRAFRAPNDYERHYHDGLLTQKPSPALKPERIESYELAADTMLSPALRLSVGHYRYILRDLIDQITDTDGLLVFRNQEPMRAQGWETEVEALFGAGWRARASLTWQRVRQAVGQAGNSPQRLGKLLLDGPLPWPGWTLGLNMQAMSGRVSLASRAPGYVNADVLLRREFDARRQAVSIGLRNLSGKRILDPGAREHRQDLLPGEGRQVWLRWELGF